MMMPQFIMLIRYPKQNHARTVAQGGVLALSEHCLEFTRVIIDQEKKNLFIILL